MLILGAVGLNKKKDGLCRLQSHKQVNVIEFTYNPEVAPPPEDPDESRPIPNSVTLLYDEKQQSFSMRVCHSYIRVMSYRSQAILNGLNYSLGNIPKEAVFTKGERDWTTKLIYVSRILVIVKLFTDVYSNATK